MTQSYGHVLSLAPLLPFAQGDDDVERAAFLGVPRESLGRWRQRTTLSLRSADAIALRLGLHPLNIWGEEWSA